MKTNAHNEAGVQLGGIVGDEFKKVWRAIRENQIVPSKGTRVSRTTRGTTVQTKVGGFGGDAVTPEPAIIETRAMSLSEVGFGTISSTGYPVDYSKEELFFMDDMNRIIAKPPIADRDSLGLATPSASRCFWGKNDNGWPTIVHDAQSYPTREIQQGFPYPWISSLQSNGGDWTLEGMQSVPFDSYTPILITPIDPPIVVQMHPASGLGSVLQGGNYIESADPSSLFDTLIAPHIVGDKDGSFVGIKCSYLDLNVEGRYWKNSTT